MMQKTAPTHGDPRRKDPTMIERTSNDHAEPTHDHAAARTLDVLRRIGATTTQDETELVRTLDGYTTPDNVVFVVGANVPGYLPESDVYAHRSIESALDDVRVEIVAYLDSLDLDEDGDADDVMIGAGGYYHRVDLAAWDSARADGDVVYLQGRSTESTWPIGDEVVFLQVRNVRALDLDPTRLAELEEDGACPL